MAKIPLRAYLREIEGKIDREQFEEVIAHCRQILEVYPKHIDTYRVLGKAFLEAKRYSDAADILQRVLSSLPGDFIANLGMSIIREDEGNLDDAIWYMERAFEIQPANSAIQAEMQRLYGRRDGVEPPRIRLTRGALARMYVKGGLYPQAIAEIRATLADDPERPDLQALLGTVYLASGQRVEAAQVCSDLLKKLPYCLEANRILADILTNTERDQEAQIYWQRTYALDPYAAHLSNSAPTSDLVPDESVMIEALDWELGGSAADSRPDWAQTLGVDVQTEEPSEANIPDWMREAGWEPATGEGNEAAEREALEAEKEEDVVPAELEEVDMPDWLKDMAPSQPSEGQGAQAFNLDESDLEAQLDEPQAESATAGLPEWLASIGQNEEIEPPSGEGAKAFELPESALGGVPPGVVAAGAVGLAAWIHEFPPQGAKEAESEQDQVAGEPADEGEKVDETEVEAPGSALLAVEAVIEAAEADQEQGEAWEPEESPISEEAATAEGSPDLSVSQEEQDAAFAWLESLAARQGAEEALLLSPEERLENPPDWIQESMAEAEVENIPQAEAEAGQAEVSAGVAEEAEIPASLAGLSLAEHAVQLPEEGAVIEETPSEWLPAEEAGLVAGARAYSIESSSEEGKGLSASILAAGALSLLHTDEGVEEEEDTQPTRPQAVSESGAAEAQGPTPEAEMAQAVEPDSDIKPGIIAAGIAGLEKGTPSEAEVPQAEHEQGEAWEPEESPIPEEAATAEGSPDLSVSQEEQDAAFAWLESLAARQGAEEALLLSPEERLENPPDWIQESMAEAEDQDAVDTEAGAIAPLIVGGIVKLAEITDASAETVGPPDIAEQAVEMPSEAPIEEGAPVSVEEPTSVEAQPSLEQEVETVPASPESEEAVPELPTWLASFEEEPQSEEEPAWMPPPSEAPRPLLDLNRAALNELERLPGIGFIRAQNILQHRQAHGDFTNVEDLKDVPGFDAESVAEVRDFFFVEAAGQPSQPASVEPLEAAGHPATTARQPGLETVNPDQVTLIQARNALIQANRNEAMVHYNDLIRSQRLLPEVIQDLHEVLYRFPVDVEIWQALGDAYLRSDQLKQALDAYTKAEELLR